MTVSNIITETYHHNFGFFHSISRHLRWIFIFPAESLNRINLYFDFNQPSCKVTHDFFLTERQPHYWFISWQNRIHLALCDRDSNYPGDSEAKRLIYRLLRVKYTHVAPYIAKDWAITSEPKWAPKNPDFQCQTSSTSVLWNSKRKQLQRKWQCLYRIYSWI